MPLSSFMASSKLKTREEVAAAVHRALVEIYTLHEASMPLMIASTWEDDLPELSGISFSHDTNGNVTLNFGHEELRGKVLESTSKAKIEDEEIVLSEEDVLEETEQGTDQPNDNAGADAVESELPQTSGVELDSISERQKVSLLDAASRDDSWRHIPLDDPEIKFAVCPFPQLRGFHTNNLAGTEACHAADRHSHSRPGH